MWQPTRAVAVRTPRPAADATRSNAHFFRCNPAPRFGERRPTACAGGDGHPAAESPRLTPTVPRGPARGSRGSMAGSGAPGGPAGTRAVAEPVSGAFAPGGLGGAAGYAAPRTGRGRGSAPPRLGGPAPRAALGVAVGGARGRKTPAGGRNRPLAPERVAPDAGSWGAARNRPPRALER
jgi:hypothetical protein